jgi:hypothetical protein
LSNVIGKLAVVLRGCLFSCYRWKRRQLHLPGTPSDRRSAQNVRSGIRRILKADGLITAELVAPPTPPPKLAQRVSRLERLVEELMRRVR